MEKTHCGQVNDRVKFTPFIKKITSFHFLLGVSHKMPYSAFIMKTTLLFIIFSLFCSEVFAIPCENAWDTSPKIIHPKNLRGRDLSYAELQGQDFTAVDFTGANLTGAKLHWSTFWFANFKGALLEGANFYRADLRGADLRYTKLERVKLQEADLRGAKVTRSQAEYLTAQGFSGFIVVE